MICRVCNCTGYLWVIGTIWIRCPRCGGFDDNAPSSSLEYSCKEKAS